MHYLMSTTRIRLIGEPVLRKLAKPFANVEDARETLEALLEVVHENREWGLAAPQLGFSEKAFLMATPRLHSRKDARKSLPTFGPPVSLLGSRRPLNVSAIINPKIFAVSEQLEADFESCLSVPGMAALVPRHVWIDVSFLGLDGGKYEVRLHDHAARLFQHEFDHLEGILFPDRVLNSLDFVAEDLVSFRKGKEFESEGIELVSDGDMQKMVDHNYS